MTGQSNITKQSSGHCTNATVAQSFLTFTGTKYKTLQRELKSAYYAHLYSDDLLNDSIIKMYDRIVKAGFNNPNEKNFKGYLFMVYRNQLFMQLKKDKRDVVILQEDTQVDEPTVDTTADRYSKALRITDRLIEQEIDSYIESRYEYHEVGWFKMYYRNKISYQTIANLTKWSFTLIYETIKRMYADVNEKFGNLDRRRLSDILTDDYFELDID